MEAKATGSDATQAPVLDAADEPAAPDSGRGGRFVSMAPPSKPFWWAIIGGLLIVIAVLLAAPALFVFAIGVVIAFFMIPLANRLERRGVSRGLAALLLIAITAVITLLVVGIGLAILIQQGVAFVRALPDLTADIESSYQAMPLPDSVRSVIDAIADSLHAAVQGTDWGMLAIGIIQQFLGLIGIIFGFFILPFFTFYLIKDQPKMARNFWAQVPGPWAKDIHHVADVVVADFANYFRAELVVGTILGTIVTIGVLIIGAIVGGPLGSFALLLGLIALVMELLPQIGPIISYIPALIIALATSPEAVILISIFYFVVFNIEGSILVPTFEGKMINFSGATVLVLITLGFALAGIVGAIVAMPVAAIVRDLWAYFFKEAEAESLVGKPATG